MSSLPSSFLHKLTAIGKGQCIRRHQTCTSSFSGNNHNNIRSFQIPFVSSNDHGKRLFNQHSAVTPDYVTGISFPLNNFSQQCRYLSTASHPHLNAPASEMIDDNSTNPDHHHDDDTQNNFPPPIDEVIANIDKASRYNQGQGGGPNGLFRSSKNHWDVSFVRDAVAGYEYYLQHLFQQHQKILETDLNVLNVPEAMIRLFLSPEITERAFVAVQRCKLPTHIISRKIREWERCIGTIGQTDMTDSLSLAMLEANGKAGNVGRAIKLLNLRKAKQYSPNKSEFIHAVKAIEAAGLSLRRNRNTFLSEKDQPQIDDPTRWLDAILLNMHERDVLLTTKMANRMLNTYASTGKSGKALHYFYRITRHPVEEDVESSFPDGMAKMWNRPVKVKMKMRPPPPYHKVPSQIEGKLIRKPGTDVKRLKLQVESEPDWSPALTSALSFADSVKQGACGHDPIELNLYSYSILMNVCVNRGSLWRAMQILDEVMPANGIDADTVAYNILLIGLARVGDVPTMREYFRQMIGNGLLPDKETIQAVVDGLLNLGDVVSAVSFCQDSFNQYSILPPYTTHLKILEFCLARGLVFEAKRHVSFIQQLWKWQPNKYHSEEFCQAMELTQKNPHLSKEALQKLFAYFGEHLDESDFFF